MTRIQSPNMPSFTSTLNDLLPLAPPAGVLTFWLAEKSPVTAPARVSAWAASVPVRTSPSESVAEYVTVIDTVCPAQATIGFGFDTETPIEGEVFPPAVLWVGLQPPGYSNRTVAVLLVVTT